MIIYKKNKIPEDKPIKVICIKCTSELGVEKSDIIKISQFDQREGSYMVDGFKCPVCNTEQKLKK